MDSGRDVAPNECGILKLRETGGRGLAAAGLVALVVALVGGAAYFASLNGRPAWGTEAIFTAVGVTYFVSIGILIGLRRPGHRVGQIFVVVGLLWAVGPFVTEYSIYGYLTAPGRAPLTVFASWFGEWYWFAFLMLAFSLLPQVFPTGRPMSGRWKLFFHGVVGMTFLMVVVTMFESEFHMSAIDASVSNPLGVAGFPDIEEGPTGVVLGISALLALIGGITAMVVRFRRSRGDERTQLKWFTFAVVFLIVQFVAQSVLGDDDGHKLPLLDGIALLLVPTAAAVAITRHRLYDIDLVINRTLVYGTLTVLLGVSYLGGVALFRLLLPFGSGDLSVAASTLAIAALFAPARRRLQSTIDQLFYRKKYDATQAVSTLAIRLRDEVEVDNLQSELITLLSETVQPAHAAVWLQPRSGEHREEPTTVRP